MSQDDTRERVLNAAGEVFAERGFRAATVREICRRAGVNGASVNYHFGDKQRLYVEVIRHAHQVRSAQVPLPDWTADTPAEERLRGFIRTMITRMLGVEGVPWQAQIMMREVLQPTGACGELIEDYIRPHFELLVSIVEELVAPDTPQHLKNKLAFSVIGQSLFYRFNQEVIGMLLPREELDKDFQPDQLAEYIANASLAMLGVRPLFSASEAAVSSGGS